MYFKYLLILITAGYWVRDDEELHASLFRTGVLSKLEHRQPQTVVQVADRIV